MSDKSIVWVHQYGPEMASCRYRAIIPAQEVGKINGYKTALNNGEAEIVVFSKPCEADIAIAEKAKKNGTKIIADLADDHFKTTARDSYMRIAELADGIVTGSTVMRGRIYDYLKRDSVVIPDPYEFPECEPHAEGDEFLWFGHIANFRDLVEVLPSFGERKLRIVTGPKEVPNTIPWTPQNMAEAFAISNIVLLPTSPGNEHKTANRLLNSIRAGCFAVCFGHPSYIEFKHFVWVGHFHTGLKWVSAFQHDLNDCVKAAQDYIRDRYSPQAIGKLWADYLESV